MASETRSQSLSGCFGETDSAVRKKLELRLMVDKDLSAVRFEEFGISFLSWLELPPCYICNRLVVGHRASPSLLLDIS